MQINVAHNRDGTQTVQVASLLFDLWEDYTFYRGQAERIDRDANPLHYKRLIRSSILAFFGYFEGVLNRWVKELHEEADLETMTFGEKIKFIRKAVGRPKQLPYLNMSRVRKIRNALVHVNPTGDDLTIMRTLLTVRFFSDADGFVAWLRIAGHHLKLELHPNVPAIIEQHSEV